MKTITLCVDDFAYNPAISASIISLIEKKRISATSCLTNSIYWPSDAEILKKYDGQIDIGLHFNLTEGKALSPEGQALFMPLKKLLLHSTFRKLNKQKIFAELCAQIEAFLAHFGRLPDFIDGHQHIHHFPIIRSALIEAYQRYFPKKNAYIRISSGSHFKLKSLIINSSGALNLKRQLIKLKIPHNTSFSGIYNLKPGQNYAILFTRFIEEVKDHGLIMCHPANQSDPRTDEIAAARQQEFDFFTSEQFSQMLNKIKLGRILHDF